MNGRKQFVKIGNSVSNTTVVGAGTPQGTVSGPNDIKLIINDLTFNTCYAKYVDDTTVLSVSKDVSSIQLFIVSVSVILIQKNLRSFITVKAHCS